ncbi:MAG TPA: hypothetical protein VJM10_07095 [Candidatus Methylomirabilis sp.]|nr:hypothetical protein [Candidatus Methylomirabilis sp.]
MRWGILWTLLPDAALPLIIVGIALAMILGLIRGRLAFSLLGLLVLLPLLAPIMEALLGQMPAWVSFVILAFFGLAVIRGLAALIIGQRAADTMVGNLAADLVRLVVAIMILPLRMVRSAFRFLMSEGGPR